MAPLWVRLGGSIRVLIDTWRDEHAQKEVYHLPATLPPELGVAMESLWQTAMIHAEQQVLAEKQRLDAEAETLQQEKAQFAKLHEELQNRIAHYEQALSKSDALNAETKANLIKADHTLLQQEKAATADSKQLQQRLERAYAEKEKAIESLNESQQAQQDLQQELKQQGLSHQQRMDEERQRQASSESRWLLMLDQAKQELKKIQNLLTKEQDTHKHENRKHHDHIMALNTEVAQLKVQTTADQEKITALLSELDEYKANNHSLLGKILRIQSHSKAKSARQKKLKNQKAQS